MLRRAIKSIRLDQAALGDQARLSRRSALARMTSFRMTAVSATPDAMHAEIKAHGRWVL